MFLNPPPNRVKCPYCSQKFDDTRYGLGARARHIKRCPKKTTNQNQSLPTFGPIPSARRSAPALTPTPKRQCVPAKGYPPSSNLNGSRKGHRGGSFKDHSNIRRSIAWKLKRVYEYESLPLRNRTGAATAFLHRHKISKSNMKSWREKKNKVADADDETT